MCAEKPCGDAFREIVLCFFARVWWRDYVCVLVIWNDLMVGLKVEFSACS
jgi:hypothetical protein